MSYYLDQLLDAERRAQCAAHDAQAVDCPHCGPVDDHAGCCPSGSTTCPIWPRADACTPIDTETQSVEPVPGSALQWVRFPGIAWRNAEAPQRRRIDPPRPSRFGDLQ